MRPLAAPAHKHIFGRGQYGQRRRFLHLSQNGIPATVRVDDQQLVDTRTDVRQAGSGAGSARPLIVEWSRAAGYGTENRAIGVTIAGNGTARVDLHVRDRQRIHGYIPGSGTSVSIGYHDYISSRCKAVCCCGCIVRREPTECESSRTTGRNHGCSAVRRVAAYRCRLHIKVDHRRLEDRGC